MQVQGRLRHRSISKVLSRQHGREQSLTKEKSMSPLMKNSKTSLTKVKSVIEKQKVEPQNSLTI